MSKLEPIITEKTLESAKNGEYTFSADRRLDKNEIKILIEETFGVHVTKIRTLKQPGEVKRSSSGRKRYIRSGKKAVVKLLDKEKIDLFEAKK